MRSHRNGCGGTSPTHPRPELGQPTVVRVHIVAAPRPAEYLVPKTRTLPNRLGPPRYSKRTRFHVVRAWKVEGHDVSCDVVVRLFLWRCRRFLHAP